jgi:tetratricopeptide (TPR) repeat protein
MNDVQAQILMKRAYEQHRAGRAAEAQQVCTQILQRRPNDHDALSLLSIIARQSGRLGDAINLASRAAAARPDVAIYHANLAEFSRAAGDLSQAALYFRKAIELNPGEPTFHNSLGTVLGSQHQYEEALGEHEKAVALRPNYADAHNNRGAMHRQLGRLEEASAATKEALRIDPRNFAAHHNLGLIYSDQRNFAEAIASHLRAIEINPSHAEAHSHLGMLYLLLGDFSRGWAEYEWRSEVSRPHERRWRGEELNRKTIALICEQGLGDAIQFVRYVPLVASRGGKVVVVCQPELAKLFADVPGVARVISLPETIGAFDVYCPILSLPLAFGTRLETIPAQVPYLQARKPRLGPRTGAKRVGIAWTGNPKHRDDRRRSIPLPALAPLLSVPNVQFYSLQKGVAVPPGVDLSDLTPELRDFSETAELMASLDLIISVDTSVAHLAGALGRPVWTFLAANPDWRWMLDRTDTPWYPTMRLFRQTSRGDWTDPIRRAAQELIAFAKGQ